MKPQEFIDRFVEYFNENIKSENSRISGEYNIEKAKFMISLTALNEKEIQRTYKFLTDELFSQNLSLDYIVPEMLILSEEKELIMFTVKPVASRKPLTAKSKIFDGEVELGKHKLLLVQEFNKRNRLNQNKPNTYESFEFIVSHGELTDLSMMCQKIKEESKALGYKINHLDASLTEIETVTPNQQYILRYNYEK